MWDAKLMPEAVNNYLMYPCRVIFAPRQLPPTFARFRTLFQSSHGADFEIFANAVSPAEEECPIGSSWGYTTNVKIAALPRPRVIVYEPWIAIIILSFWSTDVLCIAAIPPC